MVSNIMTRPVVCEVNTKIQSSTTTNGMTKLTNHVIRTLVRIEPKLTSNFKVAPYPGQVLSDVQISAICTLAE